MVTREKNESTRVGEFNVFGKSGTLWVFEMEEIARLEDWGTSESDAKLKTTLDRSRSESQTVLRKRA